MDTDRKLVTYNIKTSFRINKKDSKESYKNCKENMNSYDNDLSRKRKDGIKYVIFCCCYEGKIKNIMRRKLFLSKTAMKIPKIDNTHNIDNIDSIYNIDN